MLPIVLFFFIAFSLVDLAMLVRFKTVLDISYSFMVIVVSSLIMAKVVLLSDCLSLINRFSKKPLIYSVFWKTFIYTVCSFGVRFLERFVPALCNEHSAYAAFEKVILVFTDIQFWASEIWLAILLLIFVASRELIRAIGSDKILKLFFG